MGAQSDLGNAWTVKLDAKLDVLWQREYDQVWQEPVHGAARLPNGGVLLVGATVVPKSLGLTKQQPGKDDAMLWRVDAATGEAACPCNLVQVPEPQKDAPAQFNAVTRLDDDTAIAVGYRTVDGLPRALAERVDVKGKALWSKHYDLGDAAELNGVTRDGSGVLAVGSVTAGGGGKKDGWVLPLDGTGKSIADHKLGTAGDDVLLDATAHPAGGFVAVGYTLGGAGARKTRGWCASTRTASRSGGSSRAPRSTSATRVSPSSAVDRRRASPSSARRNHSA
jgi:hypothetical protein